MEDSVRDVWLDCDPGHDDALAVILAGVESSSSLFLLFFQMILSVHNLMSRGTLIFILVDVDRVLIDLLDIFITGYDEMLNLLGVSSVAGNQIVEKVTLNALGTLTASGLSSVGAKSQQASSHQMTSPHRSVQDCSFQLLAVQMWYKAKQSRCCGRHCCVQRFTVSPVLSLRKVAVCRTTLWAALCQARLSMLCLNAYLHNSKRGDCPAPGILTVSPCSSVQSGVW